MQFFEMLHLDYAKQLDENDECPPLIDEFIFPLSNGKSTKGVYLCGNSLGLQPRAIQQAVMNQFEKWGNEGVEGHFSGDTPWLDIDSIVVQSMSKLVGSLPDEVVLMNSLTCNLHLMLSSFYRPNTSRFKILMESKAFPSDYHAILSQIQLQGYSVKDSLIEISPREGEITLRNEDIVNVIEQEGSSISVVLLSGIQYYTGQLFDLPTITAVAKKKGCIMGLDLAHAVGNVPLSLHDWEVDFACWCTYKYMNCGPGSIGGCFVHQKHSDYNDGEILVTNTSSTVVNRNEITLEDLSLADRSAPPRPRLAGWWGHRREDRFLMSPDFIPCKGANGFRLSNPPVLLIACARASLDLFDKVGIESLRKKSIRLTGYLEQLLISELSELVAIFTPKDPNQRGCQLSITIALDRLDKALGIESVDDIVVKLKEKGVICDARKPDVMRVAPAPLYNSFEDVFLFVSALKSVLLGDS